MARSRRKKYRQAIAKAAADLGWMVRGSGVKAYEFYAWPFNFVRLEQKLVFQIDPALAPEEAGKYVHTLLRMRGRG